MVKAKQHKNETKFQFSETSFQKIKTKIQKTEI